MKFARITYRKTQRVSWVFGGGVWALSTLLFPTLCLANWQIETDGKIFYTDDASVFSASQRLSVDEDPTQPVLDVTDQGDDWVFEPEVILRRMWTTGMGKTTVEARGQGFIFTDQSNFSHATFGLGLTQGLPSHSQVSVRYHFGPGLFLGRNIENRSGTQTAADERVTTHFGTATLEKAISETLRVRALTRYGVRLYNRDFTQRDTHFWTIGPHVEWDISPTLGWFLGYHFERGLAKGRNQPRFKDDVSYVNHYVSSELEWGTLQSTFINLAFHYERNLFTSDLTEDERNDAHEDIVQGDFEVRKKWHQGFSVIVGVQHSRRKVSFEAEKVLNTNVWIGAHYIF